jgi:hypothetical protein
VLGVAKLLASVDVDKNGDEKEILSLAASASYHPQQLLHRNRHIVVLGKASA